MKTASLGLALLLSACAGSSHEEGASAQALGSNPIVVENALPGSTAWQLPLDRLSVRGEVASFTGLTSVNRGQRMPLKVSLATAGAYDVEVYRIGHYGGAGARLVHERRGLRGRPQPACGNPYADGTGLIECDWPTAYSIPVGSRWTSGVYQVHVIERVTGEDKVSQSWFVVRDDASSAAILMQDAVTTVQAYNNWGGKSLYDFNSGGQRAYKVSFDRPTNNVANGEFSQPLRWEAAMISWLEAQGYDVRYATNVDVHREGASLLTSHRAFLSVGHDEYWSEEQRDALETARDSGTSLGFLSANTGYWRVRFETSSGGEEDRVMVCYKTARARDPEPWAPTSRFRDRDNNRPENGLLGVMYIGEHYDVFGGFDYIIDAPADPTLRNTGLAAGALIPRLVGYEWDGVVDNGETPAGLVRIARSLPVAAEPADGYTGPQIAHMARYQAASGAYVFASGSIQWAWGLSSVGDSAPRVSTVAQQITANVLADMGALPATPAPGLVVP